MLAEEERTVADYLATEVLAAQRPDLRDFLLRTSVVDRLTGDLADALTGGVDGDRTLARLLRDNLFIDHLEAGWYRYHRLFGELLRAEARVELRAELPALQARAAQWHARFGDPVEAIRLALGAKNWSWPRSCSGSTGSPSSCAATPRSRARSWRAFRPSSGAPLRCSPRSRPCSSCRSAPRSGPRRCSTRPSSRRTAWPPSCGPRWTRSWPAWSSWPRGCAVTSAARSGSPAGACTIWATAR